MADEQPYVMGEPSLFERDRDIKVFCRYRLAEVGDGDDMVVEPHVVITSELALYQDWEDSPYSGTYRELPVWSADLAEWFQPDLGLERVWWQGCGPATPCAEGETPTVETVAWQTLYKGHVGNLEFYVGVNYIAQRLPADVSERTLEIFRDLVLAVVASREQAQS